MKGNILKYVGSRLRRRRDDARKYRRFYVNTSEDALEILSHVVGKDGYEIFRTPSDVADFDAGDGTPKKTCLVEMTGFPERDDQRPLFEVVGRFEKSVVVTGIDPREFPGAPLEKAASVEYLRDDVRAIREFVRGKWRALT